MGNSEYFPSVYEKTSCSGGKKMEWFILTEFLEISKTF